MTSCLHSSSRLLSMPSSGSRPFTWTPALSCWSFMMVFRYRSNSSLQLSHLNTPINRNRYFAHRA
ncbi:hypothetical protein M5D96_007400 [Drosophila gunungcola]|uniref:Uncharacterized protein n=1 Tax=Drosophila gunungcola TaxID=103775 RepID=A0A9P9YNI0_9MUSC|nr:hypothetical protein M5D96_007400 [Drosophila gunungcola]